MDDNATSLPERYERLRLLHQASQVLHSTLDPPEALKLILDYAVRLTRAASGSVVLINPTSGLLVIEAACGLPRHSTELKLRVGKGITGWVAQTGQPALVGDVQKDERYVMARRSTRSELAVPLKVRGEVRGVINVDADRAFAFSQEDQDLLEGLAEMAAQVIYNTWLYEQFRLKARWLESLVSVSQTIASAFNLDETLKVITREACALMEAKMCSLQMLEEGGEWLVLRASHGAGQAYRDKSRLSVADSLLGVVVRRRKPLQVENIQSSNRYENMDVARKEGLVSLLSVPLGVNDQAMGALSVYKGEPHVFSNEETRILSAFADLSAIALEKARLYERVVEIEEQLRHNEKLSALGLLAAEVAHEIRNPLTVMKMLYHSLDLHFPAGDDRRQDAIILGEKMEELDRIVEQILDFARRTEPKLSPVKLNALLDELGLLTRHKLANHRISLVRRLDPQLPTVLGDAGQLEQVFLNLILNAIEAMPHGGRLTLSSKVVRLAKQPRRASHALVEIKDSGQGMAVAPGGQISPALFKTTKSTGTGLGLNIVCRIIETHGGLLKVKSHAGKGTVFSVYLRLP